MKLLDYGKKVASFERIRNGNTSVVLVLKKNNRVHKSDPVSIPNCEKFLESRDEIQKPIKPGNCVILKSGFSKFSTNSKNFREVNGHYDYLNICDNAVKCHLVYKFNYFTDKNNKNLIHQEKQAYNISIKPHGSHRVKFGWIFNDIENIQDAPYFAISSPSITKDNLNLAGSNTDDFVCEWADY